MLNESNIASQVRTHYGLGIDEVERMVKGAASNSFKISSGDELFFLKEPLVKTSTEAINAEAELLLHLKGHGIPVADFVKTLHGAWYFKHGKNPKPISLQKFISGTEYRRSNAPKELLLPSFAMIGKINASLEDYELRPRENVSVEYCENYDENDVIEKLDKCLVKLHDVNVSQEELSKITSAVRYAQKIQPLIKKYGSFFKYLSYSSTHGDYHLDNLIFDGDEIIAVVDWTSSCYMPVCLNLMLLGLDFGIKGPGVQSVDLSDFPEGLREYTLHAQLNYYDYKLMPYVYFNAWGKRAVLSRIRGYVGHRVAGNNEIAQRGLGIVTRAISICKYLENNADIVSRQLEKYYEQSLSEDELRQHRKWLKEQEHLRCLYKQESAFRRRRFFRKAVPLWIRKAGREALSDS